jgi:hypothetical protein
MGLLPNPHSPPINGPILANGGHNNHKYAGSKYGGDQLERKKPSAVSALGILSSLEPPKKDGALTGSGTQNVGTGSWGTIPDEREGRYFGSVSDVGHGGYVVDREKEKEREKKKGFWNVRDRDKEREREREQREQRERELQREREVQLRREREQRGERGREVVRKEEDSSGELTRMIGAFSPLASGLCEAH